MVYKIKIIYLLSLLFLSSQTKANPIEIDINPADGTYKINIDKIEWLSSVETFLQANGKFYSSLDNSLLISGIDIKSGEDQIGTWTSTGIRYALNDSLIEVFECEIIKYIDLPFIRFKQNFLKDLKGVERNNTDYVSTSCPSFSVSKEIQTSLGFLSFGDDMVGEEARTMGRWSNQSKHVNDGLFGGPLILFDQNGNTLIFSSMSNFMSASMQYSPINNGSMYFGVMAGANFIPQSYSLDFIVYLSTEGINKAFEGWGDLLRNYYNKTPIENDLVNDYLGYWTDEGAYYYYTTEEDKNYEDTILDIISNFTGEAIPYRYIEYDSWWYRLNSKEPGCVIWDAPAEVFPSGMVSLYEKTNLKSTAHAKFWSNATVYATENGGKYEFLIDKNNRKSLPVEQVFWDDLFLNASKWGLHTYEQDWMIWQTGKFEPLTSNVTLGRDWLIQMGRGAAKSNISILYCMALGRHVLQSLEVPQALIARVSTDYIHMLSHENEQWRIGISSMFAHAMGLKPFKDTFWTSEFEPGSKYGVNASDPFGELESAVATLSTGPVGPGDRLGYMNKTIIMRCCNEDGLILKPSKPIRVLDDQIYSNVFSNEQNFTNVGEIWSTYTEYELTPTRNSYFGVILAADIQSTFTVSQDNCGFPINNMSLQVYWKRDDIENVKYFDPIDFDQSCTKREFCLYYVSEVFFLVEIDTYFVLIGEYDKWVPISPQRIKNIDFDEKSFTADVHGAINERVKIAFKANDSTFTVECYFKDKTDMILKYTGDESYYCY